MAVTSPAERAALHGTVRAGAPPEAFASILEAAVRPVLPAADWLRLSRDLALAA